MIAGESLPALKETPGSKTSVTMSQRVRTCTSSMRRQVLSRDTVSASVLLYDIAVVFVHVLDAGTHLCVFTKQNTEHHT